MGLEELEQHYGPKNVPEVRNVKENNKVFRENESKNLPYFAIRKGTKYAYLEYDFITTTNQLTEEAKEKVERLTCEMGDNSGRYKYPVVCSMGNIIGISVKCPLNICREYVSQVRDIVFNPDNWELSMAGKRQIAYENNDPGALFRLDMEELEIRSKRLKERKAAKGKN